MIIRRMVSNPGTRWAVAGGTFVLWGLVAASAVYWGMKLGGGGSGAVPGAPAVRSVPPSDPAAIARLLGATPSAAAPVPTLASRIQLIGVVADAVHGGAALMAVDGKPPKPYRVGAAVTESLVLQGVEPRRVTLASSLQAPPVLSLDMPRREDAPGAAAPGTPRTSPAGNAGVLPNPAASRFQSRPPAGPPTSN